jgi:hypothetical protein
VLEKCGLTFVRGYYEQEIPAGQQAAVLDARTGPAVNAPEPHMRPCRAEDFDEVLALLRQLWPDVALDPASAGRGCASGFRRRGGCGGRLFCATDSSPRHYSRDRKPFS